MADAFTLQSSLDFAKTAYDLMTFYALRAELYYDALADIRQTNQSQSGSAVQFTITNDLAPVTSSLNESSDVSAVAMSDSTLSFTLAEYGNAIITTSLGRGTSFLDLDSVVTNVLGFNAGISLDTITLLQLQAGTNVTYSLGTGTAPAGRSTVTPSNTFGAADVRKTVAALRRTFVPTINGYYLCFIHPDISYDLRTQTGDNVWWEPHAYNANDEIWRGEIGAFGGARFIESARTPIFADAGSSPTTTDVYGTLFTGRQALAKAFSYVDGNGAYPQVIPGPVTDKLRRQVPFGWYWLGVYGLFREQSIWRVESASSIGNNGGSGANTNPY
jgi:N4-gp56 family major capsid protein